MTNVVLVEDTLTRIQSHDGIIGFIIVNNAGIPIRSTLDDPTSVRYAGLVQQLIGSSRKVVKKHDASDDLIFLRLRTKKHEILIIPEKLYFMIVVQSPTDTRPPM